MRISDGVTSQSKRLEIEDLEGGTAILQKKRERKAFSFSVKNSKIQLTKAEPRKMTKIAKSLDMMIILVQIQILIS